MKKSSLVPSSPCACARSARCLFSLAATVGAWFGFAVLFLAAWPGIAAQPASPAARPSLAPVPNRTPASIPDLRAIERTVQSLVPRVAPAVVAVQVGGSTGSGIVISREGMVLTAAHVADEPNQDVRFTFPDGRTARGKTLGTNHEIDAGMMKIDGDGPWPFAELGDVNQARIGDWVLTLGHPGGFDPRRSVVVRLGRIIRLTSEALQTDCTLSAGDSGGPLFDLNGRVLGIHSRISESTAANFHVAIRGFRESWDRLAKGDNWGGDRPAPRPWFGVRGTDDPAGCRIESLEQDAPASRAGLKIGDIVKKVNNREIRDFAALRRFVAESKPGDELKLELKRDQEEMVITVKLEGRTRR
jgi:serine protease Do